MTAWSVYDFATGRLKGLQFQGTFGSARAAVAESDLTPAIPVSDPANDFILAHLKPGEAALEGRIDPVTKYIVAGVVTDRAACPVSAVVAALVVTLSGVPVGAAIAVRGTASADVVNDDVSGSVELTMPSVGNYTVTVGCWPALDFEQVFTL